LVGQLGGIAQIMLSSHFTDGGSLLMSDTEGLIVAYILDGQGSGRKIYWKDVQNWSPEQGVLWVHLNINERLARDWIMKSSGLDTVTAYGFLEDETRPRTVMSKEGVLQILRGVNHTPGYEPEDMVSVRLWIDKDRIITGRRRFILSEVDIQNAIDKGLGPKTPGGFLIALNDTLTLHMAEVIEEIDDQVDQLETDILTEQTYKLRPVISDLRRQAISLRRYLAPQREALYRLTIEESPLIPHDDRMLMREVTDRVVRYIEDLDTSRDKATILQEELTNRLAEQMTKQMLLLSIVAVIFMPLSFLVGLLGVNLSGIPGANSPWAFTVLCIILVTISAGTLSAFRYKKWL
jgi:zinc transporter